MKIVLTIIFMIFIGGLIGGMTNSIAIKMLFRPYQALFIGKWRLPFTPGLIPKRRQELANQLGHMVVNHLLTPESIQKKIAEQEFQDKLTTLVQTEVGRLFSTNITVDELLTNCQIKHADIKITEKLEQMIEAKYEAYMKTHRSKRIKTVLTDEGIKKVEAVMSELTTRLLKQGAVFFQSEEGKNSIENLVEDFLYKRGGKFSGMLQMLLGNLNIAEKIQPEIINILTSEKTKAYTLAIVKKEWEMVINKEILLVEEYVGKDKIIRFLKNAGNNTVAVTSLLQIPVANVLQPYQEKLLSDFIPKGVDYVTNWLNNNIEMMVKNLHLAEIVRDQVESFPVERLEEMVLSITRRELKMITYLGALLGGGIGFIQAIIMLVFS